MDKKKIAGLVSGYLGSMLALFGMVMFNSYLLMSIPLVVRMVAMIVLYWLVALVPAVIMLVDKEKLSDYGFSAEEMWELYSQCIVPDLAEGKVGKLWIVEDEEYLNNVYSARIEIELRYTESQVTDKEISEEMSVMAPAAVAIPSSSEPRPITGEIRHMNFYTVPTVGSRTEAWLLEHGVILHTVGEERAMNGANSEGWAKYEY